MSHPDTPDWVKDAIFYQIFPDRFAKSGRLNQALTFEPWDSPPTPHGFKGGDLFGIIDRLDYLEELGVTALYLNPIFASASNHRYHTYDYYQVDPLLGGNEAFRALLDAAHARNIRVVLDGVFNHASRGFWQFHHVLENGAGSPYVDWFYFDPDRLSFSRHFAAYPDPEAQAALKRGIGSRLAIGYQAWVDLPALPKFNTDTPAVRDFLFDVATYWIKFGIDGWRLDVAAEIDDDDFWREFRSRVKGLNPDAYIVGEIWHESRRWLQGDQFDAVMNYPLTYACLSFFPGPNLDTAVCRGPEGYNTLHPGDAEEFAGQIKRILNWYHPAVTQAQLNLLDSHDTPRFLTCAGGDKEALRLAWLFLFTYPGAPCIYYGDEIGMTGGSDPACREAFPWDPSRWDQKLRDFFRRCIRLRREHPALRRGSYHQLYASDGVYAFARRLDGDTMVIVLNAAASPRTLSIPVNADGLELLQGTATNVWEETRYLISDGTLHNLELPARSGVVLKLHS